VARIRIKNGFVVIYPEVLFSETGEVTDWFKKKAITYKGQLVAWAPENTGRLKRSIKVDERRSRLLVREIAVRFGVKYAGYTDKGTTGPIHAGGRLMPVGRSAGASGKSRFLGERSAPGGGWQSGVQQRRATYAYKRYVRGQAAQNWVTGATRSVPGWEDYRG
jgi:hypothetical protein